MKTIIFIFSKFVFIFTAAAFCFFSKASDLEKIFIDLNEKINPGVVSISVTKKLNESFVQLFPGFYMPRIPPEVSGAGSGFVIDKKGLIVTNSHVVSNVDKIEVQFKDSKKTYPAKLLGRDKLSDIAVLKVNVHFPLKPLKLGDSSKLKVGQWVAAFGNPHGYAHTLTKGIISGVKREIDDLNLFPLLQTDASINRGNSGGPLVNLKGEVIGVNNAIDAGAQGISFAIPINNVKNILQDILKYGYVQRGFIGVMLGYTPKQKGALVTGVVPGSPAQTGGVKTGDNIIKFQKTPINRPKNLVSAVAKTPVNQKVRLQVVRNGKTKTLTVIVKPVQENGFQGLDKLKSHEKSFSFLFGFEAIDSNSKILKDLHLPDMGARYPIITRIKTSSPAAKAGLRVGDLIFKFNGEKIQNAKQLARLIRKKSISYQFHILRYHHLYNQYLAFSVTLK